WVGHGAASATFDGTARLTHGLVVDGRLIASEVDVPAVAQALGVPLADLLQAGRAAADLTGEVEPASVKPPPLAVRGPITLSELWLAGPAADEFALGAGAIDATLPGVALGHDEGGTFIPTRIRIGDAAVSAPYALLTRTPDGWLLPPFLPPPDATAEAQAGE